MHGTRVAVKKVVWDLSGRNVGLPLIQIVFDTIPITRYIFCTVSLVFVNLQHVPY